MILRLADIHVPDRMRKKMDPKKLSELAESIRDNGQIQPVVVRHTDDEERAATKLNFALVAGGRRYGAHLMLGKETIEAVSFDSLTPLRRAVLELEENLQREDMDPFDVIEGQAKIHELRKQEAETVKQEWTQLDTAKSIDVDPGNLSRNIRIAEEVRKNPELRQAGSVRAAERIIKQREHITRLNANLEQPDALGNILLDLSAVLHNTDARDFIRSLPDASVDHSFGDLPWGIDYDDKMVSTGEATNRGGASRYDDSPEAARDVAIDLVPHILRVTKPEGWIVQFMNWEGFFFLRNAFELCCSEHFEYVKEVEGEHGTLPFELLLNFGELKKYHPGWAGAACPVGDPKTCWFLHAEAIPWVWYRENSRNPSQHPLLHAQNAYELIMVLNRGEAQIIDHRNGFAKNVFDIPNEYGDRIHSMEKPIPLWTEIIDRLTIPGQLILDPTFGSGNCLAAAAGRARRITGCELNSAIFPQAVARIAQHYAGANAAKRDGPSFSIESVEALEEEEV